MRKTYVNLTSKELAWLNRCRNRIRLDHKSYTTEKTYLQWVKRYMLYLRKVDARLTSEHKVEAFLTYLNRDLYVARATQDQAFNAIQYFYRYVIKSPLKGIEAARSKRPSRKRTSLAPEVVQSFLEDVPNHGGHPCRLIAYLLYTMGLRLDETLSIRIKDIDFAQSRIVLRSTKGKKDRIRPLPCNLVQPLKEQIIRAKGTYAQARLQDIPVQMDHALARKYRKASESFTWFWLFPMHQSSPNPRNKQQRVWWHCLSGTVQKAFRTAATKHHLEGVLTPHVLRHCWATHEHERSHNLVSIQHALGHKHLETTAVYVHAEMPAGCQGEDWNFSKTKP